MGERFFTDKLVLRWLEVLDVWSLDSATPFPSAYPVHASGSPTGMQKNGTTTCFLGQSEIRTHLQAF
jgi:hypothetical protein